MKTIHLAEITITNFRGHRKFRASLGQNTQIIGDNREGKSTVFDAFRWLLFGKDQLDRQDYEITPIVNGERLERVDSEVDAILVIDGNQVELRRVYHQKWVRRRGTSTEVFDGCETQYWIDGVPKKAGEYREYIDSIVDEQLFKLLTSPGAFFSLPWKHQRDFLFEVAGTVSDANIIAIRPEFATLLDQMTGKSMEDFKKELAARKRKLKEELGSISPRIDQIAKMTPVSRNWDEIEAQIEAIDSRIAEIDATLADKAKALDVVYQANEGKANEISRLKGKQRELITAANIASEAIANEANKVRREMADNIQMHKDEAAKVAVRADSIAADKRAAEGQISLLNSQIAALRAEWAGENAKEYTAQNGCLICPVFGHNCGDPEAATKHVEAQEKARESFNTLKANKLSEIQKEGKEKSEKIADLIAAVKSLEEQEKAEREKAKRLLFDADELQKRLNEIPEATPSSVQPDTIPEWVTIQAEIARIESGILPVAAPDNSSYIEEKKAATSRRDELKEQLSERALILKYGREIESLKSQAGELAQQIADIENTEFQMEEFNRIRIEEAEARINGLFQITKFKLFDKTLNGDEYECCIPQNKLGVPIAATNTAEQINAGLDVINTLSRFHNVTAPIFVDRAESVTSFIDTAAQLIQLIVIKGQKLTVINK